MQLLIATTNQGKLDEIRIILDGLPIEFFTLRSFPAVGEIEETGQTFTENSRIKAEYYAAKTGMLTVAEDSGLSIDALDGRPGIRSSRFNGETYEEKFSEIYKQLSKCGGNGSPAKFICALTLIDKEIIFEAKGTVEGFIAAEPCGKAGFGYDPIFYYPPHACTLAELSREQKIAISHRGQAFRQLRAFLATWQNETHPR